MNRTIIRTIEFTPEDIKEALIEYLQKQHHNAPLSGDESLTFELNESGAGLRWTERHELS